MSPPCPSAGSLRRRPSAIGLRAVAATGFAAGAAGALVGLPLRYVVLLFLGVGILVAFIRLATRTSLLLAVMSAVLVATAMGIFPHLPSWVSYLTALFLLVLRRPAGPVQRRALDVLLMIFLIYGLVGSVIGRIFLDQDANYLAFFAPALVAVRHLWGSVDLTPRVVTVLLRVLVAAGFAYLLASVAVHALQPGGVELGPFLHTRTYWAAVAVTGAFLLRRWALFAAACALTAVHFTYYPALTYALVVAAGLATVVLCRSRLGTGVLLVGGVASGSAILLLGMTIGEVRSVYFRAVGKTDNSPARDALLEIGLDRFRARPWTGSFFTSDISVPVPPHISGVSRTPLHDDFLQFGVGGGVFALLAAVCLAVGIAVLAVRAGRQMYAEGRDAEGNLVTLLAVAHVGLYVTAAFNPVLIDASAALLTGLVLDLILTISALSRRSVAAPETERELVRA